MTDRPGTIGQILASRVKTVVGVELVEQAIEDAKHNATENNITNVVYIAEKVEDALRKVIYKHANEENYKNVIAVLDPPRAGVHANVIRAIRGCKLITRVLYVSCNPKAAMQNFTE